MNEQEIDQLIKQALKAEAELPTGLKERLEKQIDALAEAERPHIRWPHARPFRWAIGGIAAALIGALFWVQLERKTTFTTPADTFSDPKEAALVAEQALVMLSQNLNKGLAQAQSCTEEMRQINRIINKHLKE